ncbi:hypothetical protein D9Q98_008468 [Chlorella vulgaris]|uniref:Nudix hydrolase domain-containing protein n=1 Tax=Chlorella vulgaris TaxID=3077 RepID=A0A9D4TGT2_CHLVU|nr:hypothetical protein D9Q98_008468 [Chlorella vulgaris]
MNSRLPSTDLLEEICVRFILTLPATELESFDRLLFSIEQAWWHYEDHVREKPENASLKSLTLKEFTGLIFEKVPGLQPFKASLEEIYDDFNKYKRTVPVRGAILLDPEMTKVLLVRGYKKDAGWGFPRGKLSKDETAAQCAQREVLEETGLDITGMLREQDYIDATLSNQDTRLFIVQNVPETTHFAPHVRCEIGAFGWYIVDHLPASYDESKQAFVNEQGGRHKFFNVWPYVKPLRAWIKKQRQRGGGKGGKPVLAALPQPAQRAAVKPAAAAAAGQSAAAGMRATKAAAAAAALLPASKPTAPAAATAPTAPAAAAAAPGARPAQQPLGPSRALLEFKFDREEIMQRLQCSF